MRTNHRLVAIALMIAAASTVHAAEPLQVVATTPDLAAIATAVGGDRLAVTAMARPTEDPHFVDPRPSFIRLLNRANVLIEGGAHLEAGWLPSLIESARNPHIASNAAGRIVASAGIALRDPPTQLDRSLGDVHPLGNPHYLLDPSNGKTAAATIAKGLCAVSTADCATFEEGARRFAAAIAAKLPLWEEQLRPARGAKLVAYHKNFDYLAARFGLEVIDYLEPKPGIPPSPTHLAQLVSKMKAVGVRTIVAEPNREHANPEFVAEKTGARVVWLPLMPGDQGTTDYIGWIDHNVTRLADALKQ